MLMGIGFLLITGLFTTQDCEAKGQVQWYSSLQSGLAQAKSSKKWVFVDIGADW